MRSKRINTTNPIRAYEKISTLIGDVTAYVLSLIVTDDDNDDDNTRRTIHDYVGALAFMLNEPITMVTQFSVIRPDWHVKISLKIFF